MRSIEPTSPASYCRPGYSVVRRLFTASRTAVLRPLEDASVRAARRHASRRHGAEALERRSHGAVTDVKAAPYRAMSRFSRHDSEHVRAGEQSRWQAGRAGQYADALVAHISAGQASVIAEFISAG